MLAKYSEFPEKLTIKHFILFGITIWLPPLLLLLVPYLYIQSIKKLKVILQISIKNVSKSYGTKLVLITLVFILKKEGLRHCW
jgi:hypothetical protein